MEKEEFPVRINKYLALHGYSTRLGADELIKNKKVFINGRLAVLGAKVEAGDKVEVKQNKNPKTFHYYAFNKPREVITHSPQLGEKDIKKFVPFEGVFPVGRLDKSSHGLIILTDDGRVTDRLLNPKYIHEKEYVVEVKEKLRGSFKNKMEEGIVLDDFKTKNCKVEIMGERSFRIVLTEGKKHQIRRMCEALFLTVRDLKRVRVMNIKLGNIPAGSFRELKGDELKTFLSSLGL
ncbi:MAG: pseudouridine synthase [Candidatus Paceibacterota bacterium]